MSAFRGQAEVLFVMFRPVLLIAVMTLGLLFGCTEKADQVDSTVAPGFTLQDLNGKSVSLSDYRGKVVVLEFWATWCPPCRAAIPGLETLYTKYKNQGLVILAVSMDNSADWDFVKSFVKDYRMTYPVLKGTDAVASQYRVRAIPLLLVLDKKGNIVKQHVGFVYEDALEKDVKELL
jgi:thiol-disulfide isomerase/thioredoxin